MMTTYLKTIKTITFLLLLYCSIPLGYSGEQQLYLFGGGGGPDGDKTIFDDELNLISQFANSKESSWKTSYTFDGGHSQTEKILQTKFKKATSFGQFTKTNFLNSLQDIEEKLKNLKKGDQLLLIMNTHGLSNTASESTHSIITSPKASDNINSTDSARYASMDEFEKIAALADEKGVKLALIDLSCYSGNTLKLKKKNICIISTTGENQLGYSDSLGTPKNKLMTFEGRFLNGMKKGENLENLFLNSRKDSQYQDFPMISTDTGILMNDLLAKILEPYLIFNIQGKYDFSEKYDSKNIPEALCKTQNEFSEIKKSLAEITNLYSISTTLIESTALENSLNAYRDYQLAFEKSFSESQIAGNEVKEIIRRDYPDQASLFDDEEGNAILTLIPEREKAMQVLKNVIASDKNSSFTDLYQKSYDKLAQKNKISQTISSKISAASKDIMDKFAKSYVHSDKTQELANNVASAAKLFYDKIYRSQEIIKGGNNPCKDFIL